MNSSGFPAHFPSASDPNTGRDGSGVTPTVTADARTSWTPTPAQTTPAHTTPAEVRPAADHPVGSDQTAHPLLHVLSNVPQIGFSNEPYQQSLRELLSNAAKALRVRSLALQLTELVPSEVNAMVTRDQELLAEPGFYATAGLRISPSSFQAASDQLTGTSAEGNVTVGELNAGDGGKIWAARATVRDDSHTYGTLLALRHRTDHPFDEATLALLKSTAALVAGHRANERTYYGIAASVHQMAESVATTLDSKDQYTEGHSLRVSHLAGMIAKELGYSRAQLRRIHLGSVLHDIGMVGIRDEYYLKPDRLTEDEFNQIKRHTVIGYEMLKSVPAVEGALDAVKYHHEAWDGSGYPNGLAGDQIPKDAQIVAVADAIDAMLSDRPYRPHMSLRQVMHTIRKGGNLQWAADVVNVLLNKPVIVETSRAMKSQ